MISTADVRSTVVQHALGVSLYSINLPVDAWVPLLRDLLMEGVEQPPEQPVRSNHSALYARIVVDVLRY